MAMKVKVEKKFRLVGEKYYEAFPGDVIDVRNQKDLSYMKERGWVTEIEPKKVRKSRKKVSE